MDALKIEKAVIAGFDWGARTANIIAALWPERCKAMVSVSGYLIGSQEAGKMPLPPKAELQWWYQFYFATERGRAGYEKYTPRFRQADLATGIAEMALRRRHVRSQRGVASTIPTMSRSSIHNYRWRLGLAEGEAKYRRSGEAARRDARIAVPTITMEGDANGAPHPPAAAYARKFTGKYSHRVDHRRHRPQPAAGGAASLRQSHRRGRRKLIGVVGWITLRFCNGLRLVNPFCVVHSPGSCFCTGSARGRHLMGLEEDEAGQI